MKAIPGEARKYGELTLEGCEPTWLEHIGIGAAERHHKGMGRCYNGGSMTVATPFSPRLDMLPQAQRRLWPELAAVPREFVLYGGTALALHLGHRDSVDFDFFGRVALNVASLETEVPFMAGAKVFQRDKNTLSAIVDRGGPVQVSFFGVPKIKQVRAPHVARENGLKIASLLDLAGTKASVIQLRAEAKDYIDIDALMRLGDISLPTALASASRIYGSSFNPEITLKALSYFEDEGVKDLPEDLKLRLSGAAREVDLLRLPSLELGDRDHGKDLSHSP
jgi:Nucleotidyl transferase AbiEii toxin, Type IV TA system